VRHTRKTTTTREGEDDDRDDGGQQHALRKSSDSAVVWVGGGQGLSLSLVPLHMRAAKLPHATPSLARPPSSPQDPFFLLSSASLRDSDHCPSSEVTVERSILWISLRGPRLKWLEGGEEGED